MITHQPTEFADHATLERKMMITITELRTPGKQQALDAALFERTKAERYELTLRSVLLNLEQGSYAVAKAQIRVALLSIQ